jgi:hypothetical protein
MMKSLSIVFAAVVLLAVASSASAQAYVVPAAPVPLAAYYAPAPAVAYGPVVATSYYAPQAVYYSAPAPVPYYAAAPVATPYYVASPVPVAVAPVYYGPKVVVRPKVYVRGEPVRNVLRAVTP